MAVQRIPFNKPTLVGNEIQALTEAIRSGHLAGNGSFTKKCQRLLEEQLGVKSALLTTSCTDALEMCSILLDMAPGDEVIVPSFTFVSSANAFALRGAVPVFADIRPDTLNIDENKLESLITPRTKAIVVVHYAGVGCEMDAILAIAARHGVPVIEDNAHGLFGTYKGRLLGTMGCLATQSFHDTKNFTCGEGGALLINDGRYVERAEIVLEKGTNRRLFFRGQVDKYTWVDSGSSFLPSDMLAAFLLVQLEARDAIQAKRRQVWDFYYTNLENWALKEGVQLPTVPPYCEQAYHVFYMVTPSLDARQALIAHLKERGISSVFHYLPLHLSTMGRRFGGKPGDCPVTEKVSDCMLRLPLFHAITDDEQEAVVKAVREWHWRQPASRNGVLSSVQTATPVVAS
jgi:dTDP-4-amino-4,6-dideoxygalactose transaminase